MIRKFGQALEITNVISAEAVMLDSNIEENFKRFASELKRIAPKANDFLYFSCIMLHSAEASLINSDGSARILPNGKKVEASWDKSNDSYKWVSNDPSVRPYKNCFPPGTSILLEDGTTKNIEEISAGDAVITHNNQAKKVIRTFVTPHDGNILKISVRNGDPIFTTDNHPFYRLSVTDLDRADTPKSKKFIEAKDLQKYDILLAPVLPELPGSEISPEGFYEGHALRTVSDIESVPYTGNVYNFEVEDDNSYVANGLVVHNCNGDIFPEDHLLKAYKKWIGKPLCLDHKSSSVDFVRGIIVDTYYDHVRKCVIGLCALDKVNYPDLARKVSTGYAASVSMGTAVGRAVCTDCGKVAKTEQDFCGHMRTKSGYGEINLDLQPIELSIVVNGADPQAKIKHIIAAANNLNDYALSKVSELKKLSETDKSKVEEIKDGIVNSIKDGLDKLINEFDKISDEETNSGTNDESNKDDSADADDYKDSITADKSNALNNDLGFRLAESTEKITDSDNNEALIKTFSELKSSIELKLQNIQQDFTRLLKLNDSRDIHMSQIDKKAYFQGAGDGNEPTPKKVRYEIDPLCEKLREHGDKHMEGQMDTGPVDGLHPGPDSVGMDELARKKMLARAEAEQRSVRRVEAVAKARAELRKKSYFQGGGDGNEPTPGKPKYPVDGLNDKDRNKEDKQMQGQPPFPGVGDVDGLHPSPASVDQKDELKRKEMLGRASLKAKFVKAARTDGTDDRANSAWQVFANDRLILSASVEELTAGRVDALYDVIATRDFGTKMLEKVKEVGFEKAASIYKRAQDAAPPAAPAAGPAAAPAADPAPDAAPEASDPLAGAEDADKGGDGDSKENIKNMIEETKELVTQRLSDIKDGVDGLDGERTEMVGPDMAAGKSASALHKMRVELNAALTTELKKNANDLIDHTEELELISNLYDGGNVTSDNHEYVESIANDAVAEARVTLAETMELFSSFVKYAKGTEAMMKRAELEASLTKNADDMMSHDGASEEDLEHQALELLEEAEMKHDEGSETKHHDDDFSLDGLDALLADDGDDANDVEDATGDQDHVDVRDDSDSNDSDSNDSDSNDAMSLTQQQQDALVQQGIDAAGKKSASQQYDLTTKAGRVAYRAKIAASSELKYSPELAAAHKLVQNYTALDVKPSGDLGEIETIEEKHKKFLDVAQRPVKVRKEAQDIFNLVKAGKLEVKDVDQLVAHGVDPAAVKYFHELWNEAGSDGKTFANELTKEFAKKKASEEIEVHKVKLARAYDLTFQMISKGIVSNDHEAVTAQVEEIMGYNDVAFESLKRVVAKHAPMFVKEANRIPSVGMSGLGDMSNGASEVESEDLASNLSRAFSNRRY